MRRLALLAILSTTIGLLFAGPKPKATLLFSVKDHTTSAAAVPANGRRIYYWQDSTQLYVFDRATRQSKRVLANMLGVGRALAVSPAGDRVAFTRSAEGASGQQLWTVSLDATTGLASGEPRRASILIANNPSFSPNGRSIAFATPTSRTARNLVVIPANGGPERIVAETQGDVWPIAWAKNDSIYFGVSFSEKESQSKNGVYRVSVSSGKPQFVLRTPGWGAYPGLSLDGRFIVAYDSTWDSIVVATVSGTRLHAYYDEPYEPTPDVWSDSGRAVGSIPRAIRAAHIIDFSRNQEHLVSDSAELFTPIWSPDSRRVAATRWNPTAIVVSDVDAGTRRSIPVERAPGSLWVLHWSPDGRFIAYLDERGGIDLVDVSTLTVRQLAPKSSRGPLAHWRSDSRAIMYGVSTPGENTDSIRKIEIHEVTIDGQDHVLHSIETRCNGGAFCGKIISDSLVSTWINGEYRLTNFRARGTPRLVYTRDGNNAQVPPVPTFSSNGRWMAVRHQSSNDQSWWIEIMHPDGSAHRSIPLSFATSAGGRNPWIRDDGGELIVASPDCAERASQRCSGTTFYRVDIATGKATAIASVPRASGPMEDLMISSDGRALVYLRDIEKRMDFYDFDFNELLRGARP